MRDVDEMSALDIIRQLGIVAAPPLTGTAS
jgi:hypothetical protein